MITYQNALKNLHNRSLNSTANKARIIRETKKLQELVDKAIPVKHVNDGNKNCCPMCGDELSPGARYCSWCGQRIETKGE